ncbi:MAG: TRAP transporter substrate-binding protein DctP [Pseudomonadota bacterium]
MKFPAFPSLIAASAVITMAGAATAQEVTWKMGFIGAVDSTYLITTQSLPDRLDEATDGRLKVELYDTLYPGRAQVPALRDGKLDVIGGPNNYLSGETPIFGLGHLPGLIDTPHEYARVLNDFHGANIEKEWDEKYNAKVLAHGMFDRQVIVCTQPIRSVTDFEGLKIRINHYEGGQIISRVGAKPTSVPLGETVVAMERGVVDCIMTSVGTTHGLGFYNVADYIHEWRIGPSVTWSFVVNNESWEALPDDLKEIVAREFEEIETEMFAHYDAHSIRMIDAQVAEGMERITATDEDVAELFSDELIDGVYEEWYGRAEEAGYDGPALVERAQTVLAK